MQIEVNRVVRAEEGNNVLSDEYMLVKATT